MERRGGRQLTVAVAIAVLATVLVGCSGGDGEAAAKPSRDPATAEVVDGKATTVTSPAGVKVSVPAGDATGGRLAVDDAGPAGVPAADPAAVRVQGDPVEVALTGGELTGDATIEFPLGPEQAGAVPLVERFNEETEAWELLPVEQVEIGDESVSVRTGHFSWYRPSWLSADNIIQGAKNVFFGMFGEGLAGADKPTCPRDAETLASFRWESSPDDTLFWCVGTNDDGTVIANVVNNNRYPMGLDVTRNMEQLGKFGGSWSAAALGAAFDEWGSGQVILEPREGVTFRLTDGVDGTYRLASDFTLLTWSIGMLGVAITAYVDVWTKSGMDVEELRKKVAFALSATACVAELGRDLIDDPAAWNAMRTIFVEAFGCGGDVVSNALKDSGWWWGVAKTVVSLVTGTVVGGLVGLVALGEIAGDSLRRRATYDLTLTAKPRVASPEPQRMSVEQVAIEFMKALIEGGDAARWALDQSVVDEVSYFREKGNGFDGPWTYEIRDECSVSHITTACEVWLGRPTLETPDASASTVFRVHVRFGDAPPGVDPAVLGDRPELIVMLDEPKVVLVEGIAG